VEDTDETLGGTIIIEKDDDSGTATKILIDAGKVLAFALLVVSIVDLILTIRRICKSRADCRACGGE